MLDGTGSMNHWIEGVLNSLDFIIGSLAEVSKLIKVGAVIYRDKPPKMEEFLEFDGKKIIPDLTDYKVTETFELSGIENVEELKKFLKGVKCLHGWDVCEDMKIGLEKVLDLEWKTPNKYLIIVTDR